MIKKSLHIVVAMSGGVDSSVVAALLKEQGHRVIGVTLRLLSMETGFGCCGSTRDTDDARAVCARLEIPHYVMNFSDTFHDHIINPFVASYQKGETPNPCIACNRFVKFDALLEKATALGADKVATGHYARVLEEEVNGRPAYRLARALYRQKDQSYVLYHLGQKQLSRLMFPVGELTKPQVRELAAQYDLKTAGKPESQEICFVPGADTPAYLKKEFDKADAPVPTAQPGPIQDRNGKLLGTHRGVAFYTRGQRSGLNLSLGRPVYIVDLDPATNTVVVGDDAETLAPHFTLRDVYWSHPEDARDFEGEVQIRSRHGGAPCRVEVRGERAEVFLPEPQRAVTPGQAAVFYQKGRVIGGGVIDRVTLPSLEKALPSGSPS